MNEMDEHFQRKPVSESEKIALWLEATAKHIRTLSLQKERWEILANGYESRAAAIRRGDHHYIPPEK